MSIKSIFAGAVLLASVCLLTACSKPAPAQEPVRAVRIVTVGLNPVNANTEFAGEVRARVESRLGFRVGGKLVRRQAEPGQRVKAGQVLAQLDPQDYMLAASSTHTAVALPSCRKALVGSLMTCWPALSGACAITVTVLPSASLSFACRATLT